MLFKTFRFWISSFERRRLGHGAQLDLEIVLLPGNRTWRLFWRISSPDFHCQVHRDPCVVSVDPDYVRPHPKVSFIIRYCTPDYRLIHDKLEIDPQSPAWPALIAAAQDSLQRGVFADDLAAGITDQYRS